MKVHSSKTLPSYEGIVFSSIAMGRRLAHKVGAPSTCWEVMWPGKSPFPHVDITAKYSNNFRFKVPGSMARERPNLADPDKCPHEHFKTLKRKLFEYLAVMSTGGNGDLPGHITSQHVEGAPTLCAKTRPMAIFTKLFE